jgi:RimJ/RimL family protein N-acetyltransferase
VSAWLFETERLAVRAMQPLDEANLWAVYGDPDAMRYVHDGQPIPREDCARWVEVTARNVEQRGYGMSAIELRELHGGDANPVIGFCGLVHPGGQPEVELKYALLKEHWGRGLATEAARGLLAWGVARFGMDAVIATTAPGNLGSHRVLAKCGFERAELRVEEDGEEVQVFRWRRPSE